MKKDEKNTMEESLKKYDNLSQKKPPEEPAVNKMIANLRAADSNTSNKPGEPKTFLIKPLKGETKEQFKERLKKTMELQFRDKSEKENRFGMNDEDIVIEKEK